MGETENSKLHDFWISGFLRPVGTLIYGFECTKTTLDDLGTNKKPFSGDVIVRDLEIMEIANVEIVGKGGANKWK